MELLTLGIIVALGCALLLGYRAVQRAVILQVRAELSEQDLHRLLTHEDYKVRGRFGQ